MPVCTKCEAALADGAAYCHKCGSLVATHASAHDEARLARLENDLAAAAARIHQLEENQRATVKWIKHFEGQAGSLPKTQLLDRSFWNRALAAWGHVVAVQLVFGVPIGIIVLAVTQSR